MCPACITSAALLAAKAASAGGVAAFIATKLRLRLRRTFREAHLEERCP